MTDTPTPPMTPEQRAELVAELRLPWFTNGCEWYQVRAANSLEADGATIATLTAECDTAQAEIARLTAALATPDQIAALAAERAKLDKAVEALRFYANGENWMINGPLDGNSGNYTGGPAKAVLAEIGGA